ncbi:MAG: ATP-binding protein [Bacillota bacterium]|nr:ATP-binding protein [Bacillota bacterium]
MKNTSMDLHRKLEKIILYRGLLRDKIVKLLLPLLEESSKDGEDKSDNCSGYELLRELLVEAEKRNLTGDIWRSYILDAVIMDENPFSLACERGAIKERGSLYNIALHDFQIIRQLYNFNIYELIDINQDICLSVKNFSNATKETELSYKEIEELNGTFSQDIEIAEVVNRFAAFYKEQGCGKFARYSAFRFEKGTGLNGISGLESVDFEDLIGIEIQRQALTRNTEAFLNGAPANNVLLYGDRGTGKSSSIKALLNRYKGSGLRIIEITRHNIDCFHLVLEEIKERGLHFIILLDDLSFEEFETDYKYLKSVIEGGIEGRPSNVLIYATSNRRHIIKESWKDRGENSADDINTGESLQEKLSLVDRFGETIIYTSPDKLEYLHIVEELAARHNIGLPLEELRSQALKWELWHNGKSGRTAQHFINSLLSESR